MHEKNSYTKKCYYYDISRGIGVGNNDILFVVINFLTTIAISDCLAVGFRELTANIGVLVVSHRLKRAHRDIINTVTV